jgi:hypothetical protein
MSYSRGSVVPPIGTKLDAVPFVNSVMPPLDEDMFHGYEDFVLPPDVLAADDHEDEDVANDDEEGGSQNADVYACFCSCRQCWASKCRGL